MLGQTTCKKYLLMYYVRWYQLLLCQNNQRHFITCFSIWSSLFKNHEYRSLTTSCCPIKFTAYYMLWFPVIHFHADVECRDRSKFQIFSSSLKLNFHYHIWIQREKCIQMSTNKPSIGSVVLKIISVILGIISNLTNLLSNKLNV